MKRRLSRRTGLRLEAFGSILIATVMLTDRFLFPVQEAYLLSCACVSAAALAVGVYTVRRWDGF